MKNFSLDLREYAEKIINYEQTKIIVLAKKERKKERKHIEIKEFATYVKEHLVLMMINIIKLRIIVKIFRSSS